MSYPDYVSNDRRIIGFPVTNDPTNLLPCLVWNNTTKKFDFKLLTNAEINDIAGSKITGAITNATMDVSRLTDSTPPAVGDVLTWDGNNYIPQSASGSVSELEFLQSKDAAGKLRIAQGSRTTTGTMVSITPPNGTTTVIYKVSINCESDLEARNNFSLIVDGSTIENIKLRRVIATGYKTEFTTKGKQLIGNGAKTIQVDMSNTFGADSITAVIEAYDL